MSTDNPRHQKKLFPSEQALRSMRPLFLSNDDFVLPSLHAYGVTAMGQVKAQSC